MCISQDVEYKIQPINESYIDELLKLQEIVVENLPRQDLFYPETRQNYNRWLSNRSNGFGLGVFHNAEMIGYLVVAFPGEQDENLGLEIDINYQELNRVARYGLIGVHPAYRKLGLVEKMMQEKIEILRKQHYKHICCTVSPHNYPSLKMLFSHGFTVKKIMTKFGNLTRCIAHLDLENSVDSPVYSVAVDNNDIKTQRSLLEQGFYGYSLCKNNSGYDIVYGHANNSPILRKAGV
jgi:ribosomal protein S18 acetylase RimI-like enzyme